MYIMSSLIIIHIGSILNSVPDRHVLLELLAAIKNLWYEIGLALKVPDEELDSLQQKDLSDINKLSKVLKCWVNQCAEVTWQSIISAVGGRIVGQTQISQDIKSYVLQANGSHMSFVEGGKGHHT